MKKIVIIGAGAAGINAAKAARKTDSECSITIFSSEPDFPYYRPYLTEFIGDRNVGNKANFYLNPADWYAENRVNLQLSVKIVKIDKKNSQVIDMSGKIFSYDSLIIATGATPFVPMQSALEKEFVFAVRTINDAKKVEAFSGNIKKAVVIGGGLLGLEAVWSLVKKGISVTVIERAPRLLPIQLDLESSEFLSAAIRSKGVEIITGASTEGIITENEKHFVTLQDGRKIETGMVLFAIGIRAEISLAKDCCINTDRGILVNERMETSAENIFACGDAAQFGTGIPLWMPAMKQGTVAGTNAAGGNASFAHDIYPAALNAFDMKLISIGTTEDYQTYYEKSDGSSFRKLFFKNGVLSGAIIINDPAVSTKVLTAVKAYENEITARKLF